MKRRGGFTIIEIAVVVIIIAILVTLSAVVYRGIRERAEASAIITHVKQYANILELYIVQNGRAPRASWRCLGDATTLPAGNGYEENFCFNPASNHNGANGSIPAPADPALMEELRGIENGLPTSTFPEVKGCVAGRTVRGVIYDGSTNNFPDYSAVIVYCTKLKTCPIGDRVAWWTGTNPDISGCAYRLSKNEMGQPRQ